jgi:transcriptional regulator with XRE-family HTH domain
MSLAENIRRLRKDKGWTQIELAEKTGLRVAHVYELEKGKGDPKLSTLYKLMTALGCSPDSLLMDTERVTTDALLKQALERALALDEDHKRIALHNLDMYCIAAGMIHQTNSHRSLLRFLVAPLDPVLPTPPNPPAVPMPPP